MKPLADLSAAEAQSIKGIIFDLDDTLLDHGALSEMAYGALFRLKELGLMRIACTGRPAGWAEIMMRQWPLDAAIAENGALAYVRRDDRRIIPLYLFGDGDAQRGLRELSDTLLAAFPQAKLADDNAFRKTDLTIDIGEHCRVAPADVDAMRAIAKAAGVRTLVSSVHLHLMRVPADKASGTLRLLAWQFGEDPTAARSRFAFIGDSGNDATAFGAFHLCFGVANARAHLSRFSIPPRYVARAPMGLGFAEIVARLQHLRAASSLALR